MLTGLKTKVSALRPAEWEAFSTTLLDFGPKSFSYSPELWTTSIYCNMRAGSAGLVFSFCFFSIGQDIKVFYCPEGSFILVEVLCFV